MMRWWIMISCFFTVAATVSAQAASQIELNLQDKTWFTDRVATAVIYFDTVVEAPEDPPNGLGEIQILDTNVQATPDNIKGQSVAVIRFLPMKSGRVSLPSFTFRGTGDTVYTTLPVPIQVSKPKRSSAMSLELKSAKQRVFAGEPLRIDMVWDCALPAGGLKALRLNPAFFSNPHIEVVVPRNTAEEGRQMGMPIGGRRVIATRTQHPDHKDHLGHIELPIFLRFTAPGTYTLPATRLECARPEQPERDFGRYAAHFNNSLFEPVDASQQYERIYTTAPEMVIEVLPLPSEGQDPDFSGLFLPLSIEVSASPAEVEIGQLIELEIKLNSDAGHGMLELPMLSHQTGLRERFLVDEAFNRRWHKGGTIFKTRLRALSTSVSAVPALQIQVFDPDQGIYQFLSTNPVPLTVKPNNGRDFIALKSFEGAAVTLSNQPEGIWHNLEARLMNDLLNTCLVVLNQWFWPLMLSAPILFLCLLPVVRERRRRADDERYRLRTKAYADFKKLPAHSKEKWPAFMRFMALSFGSADKAWTLGDSKQAMKSIGVPSDQIDQVMIMHAAADTQDFSADHPHAQFAHLDTIARSIVKRLGKGALLIIIAAQILSPDAQAVEWTEAGNLFTEAQKAPVGSEAALALYTDAALKFQAEAALLTRPGAAWYNAGNAWFHAGEMGRSIVAYRQAQWHRPFDSMIAANLAAARPMTLNDVPISAHWWDTLPQASLRPMLVAVNLLFWGALLLTLRYRHRKLLSATAGCGLVLLLVSALSVARSLSSDQAGVVVVDAVHAKKGPGYGYANAFNEPLHDGLEFSLLEIRDNWAFIELSDYRQCWINRGQIELIKAP